MENLNFLIRSWDNYLLQVTLIKNSKLGAMLIFLLKKRLSLILKWRP